MWAKRVLWASLASWPVLLLGWIGIHGRYTTLPYDPPAYSSRDRERVMAYVEPIRDLESALPRDGAAPEAGCLLRVADRWRRDLRAGQLQDVSPPAMDEAIDSASEEIRQAKQDLIFELGRYARRREAAGDPVAATRAYALILEIGDAGKYSDFPSIRTLGQAQVVAVDHLERLIPAVPRPVVREVADAAGRVRRDPDDLHRVVGHFRAVHLRELADTGREASAIVAMGAFETLTSAVDLGNNPMRRGSRWSLYAQSRVELMPISSGLYSAANTEARLRERLAVLDGRLAAALWQGPRAQSVR